jgi:hypothetical protein
MPDTSGKNKTNKKHRNVVKKKKREYNFNKKREFGEGKIGKKIAKAVTPKSLLDVIPVSKVVKGGKAIYNYLTT